MPPALIAVAITLALAAAALLYGHRPAGQFFYPRCTFHATTGWLCPGCGGLRAAHELLHGHWLAAVRCNALFVLGCPAFALGWGLRRWRGRSTIVGPAAVWWMFGISMVFTVFRNLPIPPAAWFSP